MVLTQNLRGAALGLISAGAMLFGGASIASAQPVAPPPNCTAGDLAVASGTVGTAMGDYLFIHPDVNDFFTSLRGQPNEEIHDRVSTYMDAHPQVQSEINGIRQPLTDLTLYELMVDDFTAEYRRGRAPLAAVIDRLNGLRDLGVTAIEFMPWTAWKNQEFDWGYEPFQYFAVEARYANDLDQPPEKLSWLKRLVSESHDRGIHVIMDGVFNHVSYDFPYPQLYQDPSNCPFTGSSNLSGVL